MWFDEIFFHRAEIAFEQSDLFTNNWNLQIMFNRLWKKKKSLKDPLFTIFFFKLLFTFFFKLHTKGGWPPARILMHSFTDTTGLLLETLWSQTIKLNHTVSNSKLQRYKNNYVQCGPSMMSWVDPYPFIESIHTLNKKVWINSNLSVWIDSNLKVWINSIKGYGSTQDIIDVPHCSYQK